MAQTNVWEQQWWDQDELDSKDWSFSYWSAYDPTPPEGSVIIGGRLPAYWVRNIITGEPQLVCYTSSSDYELEMKLAKVNYKLQLVNLPHVQKAAWGVYQEVVPGETLTDYLGASWGQLERSPSLPNGRIPKWMRSAITRMHIFDHLFNQVDRHGENVIVDGDAKKLWAIDNSDICSADVGNQHVLRIGRYWGGHNRVTKLDAETHELVLRGLRKRGHLTKNQRKFLRHVAETGKTCHCSTSTSYHWDGETCYESCCK